jgi:hypothetical protein
LGINIPIYPQALKGCRGQLDARISIKTGSIDRSAHEVDTSSSSRASRSFPRISRHLPKLMSCLHLTKTCTVPPQVWHPGARVSRPHPSEYDPPNPANYVGRGGGSSVSLATACRARRGAFASDGTMDQKGKAASRGRGGWNFSRMAPGVTTDHPYLSLNELRGLNHDHDDVSPEQGGEDDAESCTFLGPFDSEGAPLRSRRQPLRARGRCPRRV